MYSNRKIWSSAVVRFQERPQIVVKKHFGSCQRNVYKLSFLYFNILYLCVAGQQPISNKERLITLLYWLLSRVCVCVSLGFSLQFIDVLYVSFHMKMYLLRFKGAGCVC